MGATLAELVPKLKTHVSGLVDWSYLSHANSVLLECRRVLSNAYVFAFFMFDAESFLEVRVICGSCLHVPAACAERESPVLHRSILGSHAVLASVQGVTVSRQHLVLH